MLCSSPISICFLFISKHSVSFPDGVAVCRFHNSVMRAGRLGLCGNSRTREWLTPLSDERKNITACFLTPTKHKSTTSECTTTINDLKHHHHHCIYFFFASICAITYAIIAYYVYIVIIIYFATRRHIKHIIKTIIYTTTDK